MCGEVLVQAAGVSGARRDFWARATLAVSEELLRAAIPVVRAAKRFTFREGEEPPVEEAAALLKPSSSGDGTAATGGGGDAGCARRR